MGCNVVEPGYIRPKRGILESDDILAKDRQIAGIGRDEIQMQVKFVSNLFGIAA
jgi:hypothetical protein